MNPNYAQAYHWYANQLFGQDIREQRLALHGVGRVDDCHWPRLPRLTCASENPDAAAKPSRITSYNVCYTKLLRVMARYANDRGVADVLWVPGENR